MSNHSDSRRLHAAAWTVLILAQLVAWRGDAGFEFRRESKGVNQIQIRLAA